MIENTHVSSIGNVMYTNYAILLILVSIILLLAMVGAIVITIKQKNLDYEVNNISVLPLQSSFERFSLKNIKHTLNIKLLRPNKKI
jgi:hypothetical protein